MKLSEVIGNLQAFAALDVGDPEVDVVKWDQTTGGERYVLYAPRGRRQGLLGIEVTDAGTLTAHQQFLDGEIVALRWEGSEWVIRGAE